MSEFFKGTLDEAADRINWLESSIAEWRSVALAYSREAEAARATASLLLDQVAALKAERDALLDALREYAHHKAGCSVGYMGDYNGDCDCGLIAAIDAAKEKP